MTTTVARWALSAITLIAYGRAMGDPARIADPTRPVMELGRTYAVLQWYTQTPCPTRLQIRPGTVPCNTPQADNVKARPWDAGVARVVPGPQGNRTYHRLRIDGLRPGARYSYRIYDPGAQPTGLELRWGASAPWRREYSFSTLAEQRRRTIIRIPVKVLLMPNVWNVASAHPAGSEPAPPPPMMSDADIARVKAEYDVSARFLFINSGMRVWYDYRIFVDRRAQRWGDEPTNAAAPYRGLPVCRSYSGQDYSGPGGGDFTIVDTKRPEQVQKKAVREPFPYVGQIEQAFPRRWNASQKKWEFYGSGGGTYGLDEWHNGIPGRSQYLGGSDTAWLATHEFHHQIESLGAFSLANREDDRVIFDHFFPRKREKRADGTWDEWVWSTSWKHGEHWDGIALFDKMLTPVQWLRLHFGETITVADADEDGVPDADQRLPFDEKRFGSDPAKPRTDGRLGDLAKAQLSTWAPAPLTTSWDKAPLNVIRPNPRKPDSDGDGLADDVDPYPLYPWQPFIWPMTAAVDGSASEWADVPLSGSASGPNMGVTFRQAYDDNHYYACLRLTGDWARVWVGLDGEGLGYYTTNSTYAFEVRPASNEAATVRAASGNRCPGMTWKAGKDASGATVVEIAIANRGDSLWFWQGAGREVGASLSVWSRDGRPMSVYEPYALFYARMLDRSGRVALPPGAPNPIEPGPNVSEFSFAGSELPRGWTGATPWWSLKNGAARYADGPEDQNQLLLSGLTAREFDLWVEFEAGNDMHIGAWTDATKTPANVTDYVTFLGGFGNARSAIRAFGNEVGSEESGLTPGRHTAQFTRRAGKLWVLLDGKPFLHGTDPAPDREISRVGFLGGWEGRQAIYSARLRVALKP